MKSKELYEWLCDRLGWLGTSNRLLHIGGVFCISLLLGWAAGIAATVALEAKGVRSSRSITAWDWLDVAASLIGCALGGTIHFIVLKHW